MDHDDSTIKNYVERGTGHLVVTSGIHYTSLSQFVQSDLGCYYIGHYKPCHLLVQTHTGFWQIAPILVSSSPQTKQREKNWQSPSMGQIDMEWCKQTSFLNISCPLVLTENLPLCTLIPELKCVWGIICPVLVCCSQSGICYLYLQFL